MKKIIAIIVLFTIVLSTLGACKSIKENQNSSNSNVAQSLDNASNDVSSNTESSKEISTSSKGMFKKKINQDLLDDIGLTYTVN